MNKTRRTLLAVAVPLEKIVGAGLIPVGGTSDEYAANLRKTYNDWTVIVKKTNLKME